MSVKASTVHEYGEHATAFMRRMLEMGVNAAIKAELDNPSWDDQGWCRMVVDLAARRNIA